MVDRHARYQALFFGLRSLPLSCSSLKAG